VPYIGVTGEVMGEERLIGTPAEEAVLKQIRLTKQDYKYKLTTLHRYINEAQAKATVYEMALTDLNNIEELAEIACNEETK
jgi:hypothetical protein